MQYNSEQAEAIAAIQNFISSPDEEVFILRGNAGTGKTTLIRHIVDYLNSHQLKFQLMAPTGRAANILGQKCDCKATTIHRGIYNFHKLQVSIKKDVADSDFHFVYPLLSQSEHTICIVDEASMVGNRETTNELFTFGTSHLLNDLLTYAFSHRGSKIIFVGDPAQLPPVGESESKALSDEYIMQLGRKVCSFDLKMVMRQNSNSLILKNANIVRESFEKEQFSMLRFETGRDVQAIEPANLLDLYFEECSNIPVEQKIIITYSNNTANQYNVDIRKRLWNNQDATLQPNDRLIVVQNHYDRTIQAIDNPQDIMNGEFLQVVQVGEKEETLSAPVYVSEEGKRVKKIIYLSFRDVVVRLSNGDIIPTKIIISPLLNNGAAGLTIAETKALYINFCIRHPELKGKENEEAFISTLHSDPYVNALRVKYGYAVTCHKGQGGEWDTVFVDYTGVHLSKMGAQWIYTATTRARRQLYCVNIPNSVPTDSLQFASIAASTKPCKDYPLPINEGETTSPFHDATAAQFLIAQYCKVCAQLQYTDYRIVKIDSMQYRERYHIAKGNNIFYVDFMYNRNGIFRNPTCSNADLLQLLQSAVQTQVRYATFHDYAPSKNSFQYLYEQVLSACDTTRTQIVNIVEHCDNWKIIYCLKTDAAFTWIEFTFNAKGKITYAQPHSSTLDDKQLTEIINLLSR